MDRWVFWDARSTRATGIAHSAAGMRVSTCAALYLATAAGEMPSMSQRFVTPMVVAACLLFAAVASAQLKDGEFSVQKFSPAPGPRNYVTVEGARTDGQMAFS